MKTSATAADPKAFSYYCHHHDHDDSLLIRSSLRDATGKSSEVCKYQQPSLDFGKWKGLELRERLAQEGTL
jgi:hypothetical protein